MRGAARRGAGGRPVRLEWRARTHELARGRPNARTHTIEPEISILRNDLIRRGGCHERPAVWAKLADQQAASGRNADCNSRASNRPDHRGPGLAPIQSGADSGRLVSGPAARSPADPTSIQTNKCVCVCVLRAWRRRRRSDGRSTYLVGRRAWPVRAPAGRTRDFPRSWPRWPRSAGPADRWPGPRWASATRTTPPWPREAPPRRRPTLPVWRAAA